jgi:hypothetical protein
MNRIQRRGRKGAKSEMEMPFSMNFFASFALREVPHADEP